MKRSDDDGRMNDATNAYRTRNKPDRGAISLRNAGPTCAAANGIRSLLKLYNRLKLTKIPY